MLMRQEVDGMVSDDSNALWSQFMASELASAA